MLTRMNQNGAAVRPSLHPWLLLLILLIVYLLDYADRYLIAGLAQTLKLQFHLTDGFLGLLMGPAFALLYTILSIPLARLADKYSRVGVLVVGCVLWSLFTLLTGLSTSKWMLVFMRVGVGVGEACFIAPAYSLLADAFSPEKRGRAFAILGLAIYFGQIFGYISGPMLATVGSWRTAFIVMAICGFVMAIVMLLAISEAPRVHKHDKADPAHTLVKTAMALWRRPVFVLANLGMALGSLSGYSFGMWGPTLFARAYGLSPVAAAKTFGITFGLAGVTGMLVFGLVSDRMTRRHDRWPLILSALTLLAATVSIFLVTIAGNLELALILAVPSGLFGGGWSIGVMVALQSMLADPIRATGTALFLTMVTFVGLVFGPYLVGLLSDLIGGAPLESLRLAMILTISTGLPAAFFLWLSSRLRLKPDMP